MKIIIPMIALAVFLWLSTLHHEEKGYSPSETSKLGKLMDESTATRPVVLTRQQTQLAELYLQPDYPARKHIVYRKGQ